MLFKKTEILNIFFKKPPTVIVEPEAFGPVVGALPIQLLGNMELAKSCGWLTIHNQLSPRMMKDKAPTWVDVARRS